MMHGFLGSFLFLLAAASPAAAQTSPAPAASGVQDLSAMVVSGELPGPGLWKVSRGDHVLWLLGTLVPLPKKLHWQSDEVRAVELASQAVLLPPGVAVHADVGFFGKLMLLPRLIGVRNNPDGRRLRDVLSPELHARWLALKARHLGRSRRVEKYRPMFAASRLYEAAVDDAGLSSRNIAGKLVREIAAEHDIPLLSTAYRVEVANPKQAIKAFRHTSMDDTACFVEVLDLVERRVPRMQADANAWATGDLDALRQRPANDAGHACADAWSGADFAREQGLDDLEARVEQSWLDAADKALAENRSTLALLPIDRLLGPDGFLARLQARGCVVQAPDAADPVDDAGDGNDSGPAAAASSAVAAPGTVTG